MTAYNVLIIANQKYAGFTLMLVKSILSVCDPARLGKILIGDVGLSEDARRQILSLTPRAMILDTRQHIVGQKDAHDAQWLSAVFLKTALLRWCTQNGFSPTILLDADSLVVADFLRDIPQGAPIVVCKRAQPSRRPDGFVLEYIASFLAVNSTEGIGFIDEWVRLMKVRVEKCLPAPYETPALCDLLRQRVPGVDFDTVPDLAFSAPSLYIQNITRVVHFKSNGPTELEDFLVGRIAQVRGLPVAALEKYLDEKTLASLAAHSRKVSAAA